MSEIEILLFTIEYPFKIPMRIWSRKKLHCVRTDKAAGVDSFSPRVLFELKDELCRPLTLIMNTSLNTGVIPDEWKAANVTPIHKKGSNSLVDNYRPISLTSLICKLQESILRDAVVLHLEKNGLINSHSTVLEKEAPVRQICFSSLTGFQVC